MSTKEQFETLADLAYDTNWEDYYDEEADLCNEILGYLASVMTVLMAADKEVSDGEVNVYNEFWDTDYDLDTVIESLKAYLASGAEDTVAEVPVFFKLLVQSSVSDEARNSAQAGILALFLFMMDVVNAAGHQAKLELAICNAILVPLKEYMAKHELSWSSTIDIENWELADEVSEKAESIGANIEQTRGKTLEELIAELNSMVGLDTVKAQIGSLLNFIKIRKLREQKGVKSPQVSLHLVFTGNPGTGKTTVARLVAAIYKELGLLSKGHLVETDRASLVAGYIGQTAIKTKEVCQEAVGGVLFIDEAYSLAKGGEQDYGREAVETLLKFMEDNRHDMVVIVAGYSGPMRDFIGLNPGLESRFNRFVEFADYSVKELAAIFNRIAIEHGYSFDEGFFAALLDIMEAEKEAGSERFANGRYVRNLFEKVLSIHADRVAQLADPSDDDLNQLSAEDLTPFTRSP